MRSIKIESWKANIPIKDKDGNVTGTQEMGENLLVALNVLIGTKEPQNIPKGIEKFRIFNKIAQAFDKADEAGTLELEEREYLFLKETVEKEVPSSWGMNKDLSKAINDFLNLKEE
jgi:hypothetical protein